jgi:hypothetical protein
VVEKYIKAHPAPAFEITTVSPVGVFGKALSARDDATSMGLRYLFKHKIAPDDFFQIFCDMDLEWAIVDVRDVAEGVYLATTTMGLHGKNYILSSESVRIFDTSLMLNLEEPAGKPSIVYVNDLARHERGLEFRPVRETLNWYSS